MIELLTLLEFIAVLAFALSGFMEAEHKKVDPVGVFVVAFLTAFGGGTLRDLLLDRRPFYWVQHEIYVAVILALTVFAPLVLRLMHRHLPFWLFILADAVGLGIFAVTGTALAREAGLPMLSAAMIGVVTAVFGGVLRDVILNEVPIVLKDAKPYATAAFAGCWIYMGMLHIGIDSMTALWTASLVTVVLRMVAWRRDWRIGY